MTILGPDALLAPLHAALKESGIDEADLWVHRRRAATTRYSHSSIHQNAVSDETHEPGRKLPSARPASVGCGWVDGHFIDRERERAELTGFLSGVPPGRCVPLLLADYRSGARK